MGEVRRCTLLIFGSVFVILFVTAFAAVNADELTDSRTQKVELERNFGIRIRIPDTWVDPPSDTVIPKASLFSYIKLLPIIQQNQRGHIEIRIERTPTIQGHAFVCGFADLRADFAEQIIAARKQPIDFETGAPSGKPKIGLNFFRGVEPPPLTSTQDDPLANIRSGESVQESVLACSATTAYVTRAEAGSSQFVRAITRAISKSYVITVVLEVSPALYTTFAPDYSAVLKSINFRCGKEGHLWCAAI